MNTSRQRRTRHTSVVVLEVVLLMLVIALSGEGLAARKTSKEPAGVPSRTLIPASEAQSQRSLAKPMPAAQPLPSESRTSGLQKKSAQAEASSLGRKSRRSVKASRKTAAKAVVQPRTDLIPYAMLEDAQRYDPRPRAVSAGVPSPQRLDLTHDHFQELDRNQDGKIDPVERAFGRIDMDRDLHTRTLH